MKPEDMMEDDYIFEEFVNHFAWLWSVKMDHETVSFDEVYEQLPFKSTAWAHDFVFEGETGEEMAEKFFEEFADELFSAVIEQREHEEDLQRTDDYNAALRY